MQPNAILQSYLGEIGHAVLTERFETYASLVQLPLKIRTSLANLTVATVEDLQEGFDEYCEMMRSKGVSRMNRTVKIARFIGNDHVVGIYETRLLDGPRQVLPTFHSKMWIGLHDGVWKAVKIHNTTKDARWPMLYTQLASETWPIEEP